MTHSALNLVRLGREKSENLKKKLTTSITKHVGKRGAGWQLGKSGEEEV